MDRIIRWGILGSGISVIIAMRSILYSINTTTPQEARIMGIKGCIHIPEFWHGSVINLEVHGQGQQRIAIHKQVITEYLPKCIVPMG